MRRWRARPVEMLPHLPAPSRVSRKFQRRREQPENSQEPVLTPSSLLSVLQTERERKKRCTKGSRRGPLERGDADGEGDASVNAGLITGPTAGDASLVSLARERRKRREGGPDTSKSSTRSALRLPLHWGLSQRRGLHRGLPARLRRRSSERVTHESEKQRGSADDRERTERSGRGHRTMMPVQGESTASRVLRTDHSVRRSGGTRRTGKKDGGSNRRE